jgi:hypothetical protein
VVIEDMRKENKGTLGSDGNVSGPQHLDHVFLGAYLSKFTDFVI